MPQRTKTKSSETIQPTHVTPASEPAATTEFRGSNLFIGSHERGSNLFITLINVNLQDREGTEDDDEVDRWLKLRLSKQEIDFERSPHFILEWWRRNHTTFPKVAKAARVFLAVHSFAMTCTCAGNECCFGACVLGCK